MKLKRYSLIDKFKNWFIQKYVPEKELYYDLIYCVGKKYPNETRHETAKRYLKNSEIGSILTEARCEKTIY